MKTTALDPYRKVQTIAKEVLEQLGPTISADDTEQTIAARAVLMLSKHSIDRTWYHTCPAMVLLGSRSCLSLSGREYVPHDELVGETNLVTVDLSPLLDKAWGDCARSFFIEAGMAAPVPQRPDFKRGQQMQRALHRAMQKFITLATTFEQLHQFANEMIQSQGFENLDFMGNLGHTIETKLEDRRYIEAGNTARLADAKLFTFEPHIREVDGAWGFKHENIYTCDAAGRAVEL